MLMYQENYIETHRQPGLKTLHVTQRLTDTESVTFRFCVAIVI